jgi:hypothetical protein
MKNKRFTLKNEKNRRTVRLFEAVHRQRRNWRRIAGILAVMAVLFTVYLLILPATTMEKTLICGKEEHTHTEECYEVISSSELLCQDTLSTLHQHTDACYNEEKQLVCGYADFVLHIHDDSCYDADGQLICPLNENKGHQHTDACYENVEAADASEESDEFSEITEESSDAEDIASDNTAATESAEAESAGDDDFMTDLSDDIDLDAYAAEAEEAHNAGTSDADFVNAGSSSTAASVALTDANGKAVSCGQMESYEPHTHEEGCYILADGTRSETPCCGKLEVQEHTHVEACFPEELKVFTCAQEEHQHTDACYKESSSTLSDTDEQELASEESSDNQVNTTTDSDLETDSDVIDNSGSEEDAENAGIALASIADDEGIANEADTEDEDATKAADTEEQTEDIEDLDEENADEEYGISLAAAPVALTDDKVTDTVLAYLPSGSADTEANWINIGDSTTNVPGNATIKITVSYSISKNELMAAERVATYELSNLFQNVEAEGDIQGGSGSAGTISTDGSNTVTLTFNESWLANVSDTSNITGSFAVEAQFDVHEIITEGKTEVVVGGVTIRLDSGDFKAKYATVDLQKSTPEKVEEVLNADGLTYSCYLTYQLTVTAGADGCPNVIVVDQIQNSRYGNYSYMFVEKYVGISGTEEKSTDSIPEVTEERPEGSTAGSVYLAASFTAGQIPALGNFTPETLNPTTTSSPGVMVWTIGDMQPNESRVLTYKVKLKDDVVGAYNWISLGGGLKNSAYIYSKPEDTAYSHGTASSRYNPDTPSMSTSKWSGDATKNEDGSYTIPFYIKMTASSNNSYTYSDVRLVDWLTCSDAYMQYMDFDMDSFELYEGDLSDETAAASATKIAFPSSPTNGSNPDTTTDLSTIRINNSTANTTKHFLAYVGNMEPGEIKTLKYTVTVKPGAFILCGNENNLNVSNSAQAYYNNDSKVWLTSNNGFGGQPSASKTISHKTW